MKRISLIYIIDEKLYFGVNLGYHLKASVSVNSMEGVHKVFFYYFFLFDFFFFKINRIIRGPPRAVEPTLQ